MSSLVCPDAGLPKPASSYGQILRASSIVGGAQGINYIISLVRIKLMAVLLGPSGVGLVGLYASLTGLVGTIAGLGLDSSGVREVAEAYGSGDSDRMARTVTTLRRVCWVTGAMGWVLTAGLAYPLSFWTFGSGHRAWGVGILGITILLGAVCSGRTSLIQGTRRIGDLARLNVLAALVSTFVAVGLYAWMGEQGIVPALVSTAVINLGFAWWFARRIQTVQITQAWRETLLNSKRMITLGLAFMYGGLLAAILGLVIRSVILRELGIHANGIYQASWGISGMFAGFILSAMGTDFYPRLTAVANDDKAVNRLVNEQMEIGVLLALPGILGTLAFAPWLMRVFYSMEFISGAELLPWLAVGIFGQVITFPMGFIQRAKGRTAWIIVSQTHLNFLNLILALVMIRAYGVVAAAWAFATATYLHGIVVFGIARRLSGFSWTTPSARLMLTAAAIIGIGFVCQALSSGWIQLALGMIISTAGSAYAIRGISSRLGRGHRMVKLALRIPGAHLVCGL